MFSQVFLLGIIAREILFVQLDERFSRLRIDVAVFVHICRIQIHSESLLDDDQISN